MAGSTLAPERTYRDLRGRAEELLDEKIKERVLRGLERLKEEYGEDWVEHISPERLDLSSGSACVLGQLNQNGYGSETTKLGIAGTAYKFGFDSGDSVTYADLDHAWMYVFTGRDEYLD